MTTLVSKLALAAALTAAVPAAALGSECERDHGATVTVYPAPPPADGYQVGYQDGDQHGLGYAYGPGDQYGPGYRHDWRRAGWREQERARLRLEYARLDQARDDFYARPGLRRGQARRFEFWYASQRAELDRRWSALSWYAWR